MSEDGGYNNRIDVPEEYRDWSVEFTDYSPPDFTDIVVTTAGVAQGWADPEDVAQVDFADRKSYMGEIHIGEDGRPLNPNGRTGLRGRGKLGKWGPNHAADPIVLNWNRDGKLQVLLIQRENSQWALPGGMVDEGEVFSQTVLRELEEETSVALSVEFKPVYKGMVDDPRNTDNAWIETIAGYVIIPQAVKPKAGEGIVGAEWREVTPELIQNLYASHGGFLQGAVDDVIKTFTQTTL